MLSKKYLQAVEDYFNKWGYSAWRRNAIIRELIKMKEKGTLSDDVEDDIDLAWIYIEEKAT